MLREGAHRVGIPAENEMTVDVSTLKDCENETLVSLELDPFLKPWVQECPDIDAEHLVTTRDRF